jgi:cysteine desulfurase family protein (TIGR01976 family)
MSSLNLEHARAQFPAFSDPSLEGFAFFENAGGSYACRQVIDALNGYYTSTKVQPHYGFNPSRRAGEQMDLARQRLAAWLNARAEEVHIGPSTSQNTFVVAQALRRSLQPGDEVIVTNQDHEANIGVWTRLEEAGAVIRVWEVNPETAELESSGLENLLNDRTRMVAFTHASNIVGSINPVSEWTRRVRDAGAISIVDGVSYAPHGLPDMQQLGADIYLFSLYKVYGPHQGVMFMRDDLNHRLPSQAHFFNEKKALARFLPAGPDHAQIAAVNGVIDYFENIYEHSVDSAEQEESNRPGAVHRMMRDAEEVNLKPLLDYLASRDDVRVIGRSTTGDRAPTVSIRSSKRSPAEIAAGLAERNIGIGNGNCYAWRLMEALNIPPEEGVARLSFVHYTRSSEVDQLIEGLDSVL